MEFNEALQHELNLLMKFPDTSLEGLKVHHSADPLIISAAQRLFDKGLITQRMKGYWGKAARDNCHKTFPN